MSKNVEVDARTIRDFGEQWTRFTENDGFYGSVELFRDIIGPSLDENCFRNCRVIDIGSGTGRIVRMLLNMGAAHVCAIEPSAAFSVLQQNTRDLSDKIRYVQATGDRIPPDETECDWVVSIGVLHHITDPAPVVAEALRALKPGGRMLAWLYGEEGNEAYLAVVRPLRWVTSRVPDFLVRAISHVVTMISGGYVALCRLWPRLPLAGYAVSVYGKLDYRSRFLTVYDQLNPAYAKYYSETEALELLAAAGFENVRAHHRHGYSWTVIGEKPL